MILYTKNLQRKIIHTFQLSRDCVQFPINETLHIGAHEMHPSIAFGLSTVIHWNAMLFAVHTRWVSFVPRVNAVRMKHY